MQQYPISPYEMFASLKRHRELIGAFSKRDVQSRYRGSMFGLLWSLLNPILILAVFTLVFSTVFQVRWSGGNGSKTEFALLLFAGLIVFNFLNECISRAPSLIISNVNYVKKVVFPLEVLPVVILLSALFHATTNITAWIVFYTIFFGAPHATIIFLPIVLFPFCLFIMGVCWLLASIGVYIRDTAQFLGLITTALMFISPIFYPLNAFPEAFRYLLFLNPITNVVEQMREILYWGNAPNFTLLVRSALINAAFSWIGFVWFQKTRKGFSDVL